MEIGQNLQMMKNPQEQECRADWKSAQPKPRTDRNIEKNSIPLTVLKLGVSLEYLDLCLPKGSKQYWEAGVLGTSLLYCETLHYVIMLVISSLLFSVKNLKSYFRTGTDLLLIWHIYCFSYFYSFRNILFSITHIICSNMVFYHISSF